jgi:hypothetical protein
MVRISGAQATSIWRQVKNGNADEDKSVSVSFDNVCLDLGPITHNEVYRDVTSCRYTDPSVGRWVFIQVWDRIC